MENMWIVKTWTEASDENSFAEKRATQTEGVMGEKDEINGRGRCVLGLYSFVKV